MPFIAFIFGLFFPRLLILALYFFTDWFQGVYGGVIIPIIGFCIAPFTLLWYAAVMNHFGGHWSAIPIVGLIVAASLDMGIIGKASKKD